MNKLLALIACAVSLIATNCWADAISLSIDGGCVASQASVGAAPACIPGGAGTALVRSDGGVGFGVQPLAANLPAGVSSTNPAQAFGAVGWRQYQSGTNTEAN